MGTKKQFGATAANRACKLAIELGTGVAERARGYQRKTDRLPYPHISREFLGKIDTSTPYVYRKVVSRLEMDSRWALARSVRALVAERDALKEKLDGNSNSATGSGAA